MSIPILDFPLEIFRLVVESTVVAVGLRQSIKLRTVSRLFNDEIIRALRTTGVLYNLRTNRGLEYVGREHDEDSLVSFLARVIDHWNNDESMNALPWNDNIVMLLNTILDKLDIQDARDRVAALTRLCKLISAWDLAPCGSCRKIVTNLQPARSRGFEGSITTAELPVHLLIAAIALNRPSFYYPILYPDRHEILGLREDLSIGASVCDIFGSVLHAAAFSGEYQLVRDLLLRHDFSYRIGRYGRGPSAVDLALSGAVTADDEAMVDLLIESRSETLRREIPLPFWLCARLRRTSIITLLLRKRTEHGDNCDLQEVVVWAALFDHRDIIELLLAHGVDLSGRPDQNRAVWRCHVLPVAMAAWNGNAALMHWLLERGADPGHEAFLAAIVKGHMGALRILLEANARIGTSVGSWSFMLKYAIRLDRNQIFRYLVEDLNVLDTVAECIDDHAPIWSLLYLSCTHDNIEALDLLIQSGMPTDVSLAWSRIGDFGFVQYHTENVFLHSESIHTPMELAISHNATKVTRRLEKMDRTRMGMRYDRVVCVTEDEPNRFPPKHKIMGIPLPGNFDTMSWFSEALDDEG